ncbi:MAG: DUF1572 domain-containing protein [Bacteroidia bacterium]|nr:DUF1572 domain-containing protein [Bacteroidia bacterium]
MSVTKIIAKHLREVHFGGNWTWSNLKDCLSGLTWQQAITQQEGFNSILALVYHMNYYVKAILGVLEQNPLTASDKYSFLHPEIHSQEEWEEFTSKVFEDAEKLAGLIETLPDSILETTFYDEKYGNYGRNFMGNIEHIHYHLGQIVILKKLLLKESQV